MKKQEFKAYILNKLYNVLDQWFDTNTLQDNATKAIVKTIIQAKQHSFDEIIDVVTDEQGEVRTDILLNNIEDMLPQSVNIDLLQYAEQFNIPKWIVPNKILLLTKDDIKEVLKNV